MTALSGLRVLELASERIAFAGKLLGDMGADVILVEPPGGDAARRYGPFLNDVEGPDRSLHWWHYNTSKRGVVVDLDNPSDRARLLALVSTVDVLIESEVPGRLRALGIDYDDLAAVRPDLIHVSVTGFGRNDPKSLRPITDLTVMAGAGPVWSCGYDDHSLPPVRGGGNQGYHTGCHFAVMSVLTAMLHRMATGEGQFVDVSLHAASNVTTELGSMQWLVARETVQRQTGRHAMVHPSTESQTQCRDGRWVNTGVPPRTAAEYRRLLDWLLELGLDADFPETVFLQMGADLTAPLDLGALNTDDTVIAIYGAGREALKLLASRLDAYEFFIGCQERGLPTGIIYSPEEAYEDPHFKARGFQARLWHDEVGASVRYPGAPYDLPASPWRLSRRAPRLGEHQQEIFGDD